MRFLRLFGSITFFTNRILSRSANLILVVLLLATLVLANGCANSWPKPMGIFGKMPSFGGDTYVLKKPPKELTSDSESKSYSPVRRASYDGPAVTGNQEAVWYDSYDRAEKAAATSGRPMLVLFTGSDWCSWCTRLKNDVLETEEFKSWAAGKVVLVELDFPRMKTLPEEIQGRNNELKRKFNVESYPTVLILDEDGKELGRLPYMDDAQDWIAEAERRMR